VLHHDVEFQSTDHAALERQREREREREREKEREFLDAQRQFAVPPCKKKACGTVS